jgi:hypothetical protein
MTTNENTQKQYTKEETEKINAYLKSNNIDLDKGGGFAVVGELSAWDYLIGGDYNYELILTRINKKGKRTCWIEGPQEKINELEKNVKLIN